MNKEILEFKDRYECAEIAFGDNPNFKVIQEDMLDHSRWSVSYRVVVQRLSDGKYFASNYSVGATESQDELPYEYGDKVFTEVVPQEKVIIEYV